MNIADCICMCVRVRMFTCACGCEGACVRMQSLFVGSTVVNVLALGVVLHGVF